MSGERFLLDTNAVVALLRGNPALQQRLQAALIEKSVELRRQHRLKLPDAIIVATAVERNAALITDDTQLRKLPGVRSIAVA